MAMNNSVFLDTNFLIAWHEIDHQNHMQAIEYFKYCLENNITMKVSTIALAEYSVHGNFATELPMQNFQIISFLPSHSQQSGEFTKCVLSNRNQYQQLVRKAIPNDVKLVTQANIDKSIKQFVTSDVNSISPISNILATNGKSINFTFYDFTQFEAPLKQEQLELDSQITI